MGRSTELRRELKRRFYPYVARHGFQIDMSEGPHSVAFRRLRANGIDVFDLQWEKYGTPRFIVNFGRCPEMDVKHFGEKIPPDQVRPYMGSISGRLRPGKGSSTRSWFCQDRSFFRRVILRQQDRPAADVVDELMSLFPELEEWFENQRLGPHLRIIHYYWQDHGKGHE